MIGILFLFLVLYVGWYVFFRNRSVVASEQNETPTQFVDFPNYLVLALALIVLGFNVFLYATETGESFPAVGFAGFNLAWVIATLLAFRKKYSPLTLILALISILAGANLIFRANGFVQTVNLITMSVSNALLLFLHVFEHVQWEVLWLVKQKIKMIARSFKQIMLLFKQPQNEKEGKKWSVIRFIKTFAITFVLLLFFTGLLSSADPIFEKLIADVRDQALGRSFASLILVFFATLFFSMKVKADQDDRYSLKLFSFSDIFFPLLSIIVLFGVFLGVQANYLFGSHQDLASFGLTYSEYVRKGFTELLFTAFVGGLIALVAIIKSRLLEEKKKALQITVLNSVLVVELFFMLASAFKRDLMYVDVYGLTRVRIAGGMFLFWLASLLVLLFIMNLLKKMQEKSLFIGMGVASLIVVGALNVLNMDAMIVKGAPSHHAYKDYFYINNLSPDGFEGWKESLDVLHGRIQSMLAKTELTDIDKSQLAGDKLALISLQEKRVKLFKKYAEEQWVLGYCKEKYCLDTSEQYKNRSYPNYSGEGLDESVQTAPKLQASVKNARKWQHFNWSQYKAYQEISSNRERYFDQVDADIERIREFQTQHNVDLYKQEYRLLKEFTYPFISIQLSYYPERLQSYSYPTAIGGSFTQPQVDLMRMSQKKVISISRSQCGSDQSELSVTGMIKVAPADSTNISQLGGVRKYQVWDDSSYSEAGSLIAIAHVASSIDTALQTCGTSCGARFGQMKLKPSSVNDGDTCIPLYEIIEWNEFKQLN